MSDRTASENRRESAVPGAREESVTGERTDPASTSTVLLWEKVLERSNLQRAVKQVRQNKGAPGIDGMSVDALPDFLRQNWPAIRDQLEAGQYCPQPVRRVRIPKADGRERLTAPTSRTPARNPTAARQTGQPYRNPKPIRLPPVLQSSTHDPSPMNQDDDIERK
ncbi:hypothetical protein [Wenzhouxiangella sp. AB-CW3]|uniref:hypothetical protein n=1 Tax=Wenzhouxiangella sp. AB-CW3 TaxID=2771012 RepID=UPI001CC2A113|nr:hypothetical protein [Wenzhouxiangella sp. AB-CW3]